MLLIRRHVIERVMVCVSNDYASMRDIYKETHSMGIGVHIFFLLYALYVWYVTGHLPTVAASWSIVCVGPVESIDKK